MYYLLIYHVIYIYISDIIYILENKDPFNRLFGGDMMLTWAQRKIIELGGDISLAESENVFTAMKNVSILWLPNQKVVPYTISTQLGEKRVMV